MFAAPLAAWLPPLGKLSLSEPEQEVYTTFMQALAERNPKNSAIFHERAAQNVVKTGNSGTLTSLYYYGARYLDHAVRVAE